MVGTCTLHGYIKKSYRMDNWRKFVKNKFCFAEKELEMKLKELVQPELANSDRVTVLRKISFAMLAILTGITALYFFY